MNRLFSLATIAAMVVVAPAQCGDIAGQYVEARTCDVWSGPCFANAEIGITGKKAVMAWRIDSGSMNSVKLDGLGIVAVVNASDTLGMKQTGAAKAILLVDKKATPAQRKALIQLAKNQGGKLLANVIAVRSAPIQLEVCACKGQTCATMTAGAARIRTRCLDHKHDRACGNESACFPPLARGVTATAGVALEHTFDGVGLGHTWSDSYRRGAYVGTFKIR